ncbi:hypothetical protein imdm_946 [gamma proteobacterium IMCC2047]|nr:hypothetical protein imdm_946 [gamma proteobacterium IMCC2047]
MQSNSNSAGFFGSLWAITGFSLLILFAIVRLGKIALDSFNYNYQWFHWLALFISVVVMAYSEGYKGFQLKFSPRFAARCRHLRQQPTTCHVILAPLFCMGFFHTTRARKIATFTLTLMILCFIQIAHFLPQPWRGILDLGVVTGLIWGLLSLYVNLIKAFNSKEFSHSPELPDK